MMDQGVGGCCKIGRDLFEVSGHLSQRIEQEHINPHAGRIRI
jgi:hypothetical protein